MKAKAIEERVAKEQEEAKKRKSKRNQINETINQFNSIIIMIVFDHY